MSDLRTWDDPQADIQADLDTWLANYQDAWGAQATILRLTPGLYALANARAVTFHPRLLILDYDDNVLRHRLS